MWHCLLPTEATDDLLSGAVVCRHKAGSWNAVSADQFGEQTAIKIGKGGLDGITLSSTQVAKWIDSFPISAYISDTLDHCYSSDLSSSSSEMPYKEEGVKRCKVDEDDRQGISTKVGKFSYPFDSKSGVLYNIHNGQVATIYRFIFLCKWRCGMMLSLISTPHVPFLKTLKAGNFPGLFNVPGEESATHMDLMADGQQFFAAPYGQPTGTSMTHAQFNRCTRKQGKPLRIMLLPPTDTNLYLHL